MCSTKGSHIKNFSLVVKNVSTNKPKCILTLSCIQLFDVPLFLPLRSYLSTHTHAHTHTMMHAHTSTHTPFDTPMHTYTLAHMHTNYLHNLSCHINFHAYFRLQLYYSHSTQYANEKCNPFASVFTDFMK